MQSTLSIVRQRRTGIYILTACAIILSACAPALTPTPALPTEWLRVQVSPALSVFDTVYTACTPQGIGLAIQQADGTAFTGEQADLTLSWGFPSDTAGYAAELSQEELVLVVNPENPVQSLAISSLQAGYTGDLPGWDWDFLGQSAIPLTAYLFPENSDLQLVLGPSLFTQGQSPAREVVIAPGPAELRAAVAADAGAVGFLPRRWVDASVKVVPVNGLPGGEWTRPILAISRFEPQGAAREWLLCVQDGVQTDGS
jgi:DNA-binding transcriptional LysR family regulator